MAADIFVSFASKDVRVAMTLCSALESRGFTCWISARDIEPGANFQSAIVRALRQAKIMLLVFTANSNASEEMTKELALASQNKMIVIPLRVEDVTPNDAFAYEFATRQWIDVFADWEAAIDQLSRRVGQALLDRSSVRAGAAADALKTVIASANAAKLADAEPPPEAEAPVEAAVAVDSTALLEAAAAGEAPVEAAVKALEALEAGDAEPAAEFEAAADAELPPASDDDLWPAAPAEASPAASQMDTSQMDAPAMDGAPPDAPARKAPLGLLIGAGVAVLAVVGVVVAMANHGGSKAASAQAAASSAAAPSSAAPAAIVAAGPATPAAPSSAPPPAASDEAPSGQEPAAAAPKPVKHKKAQPKVDIPF
jgi:hypothetical protein